MGVRSLLKRFLVRKKDTEPESVGPRGTKRYESRAAELLADPEKTRSLVEQAQKKGQRSGALTGYWEDFVTLTRMVRAYVDGTYRTVPWRTILVATAAIVYFVSPIDFIPDFLAGIGLVDDMAVLAWTLGAIQTALADFRAWQASQSASTESRV
jgi:uncharacterized membrane protein YkvA (DUF1232 family)